MSSASNALVRSQQSLEAASDEPPIKRSRLQGQFGKDLAKKYIESIKKLRGRPSLSFQQNLMILHCYFQITLENIELQLKKGRGRTSAPISAQARTAKLLGVSQNTVGKAVAEWKKNQESSTLQSGKRGNFSSKPTRIPRTQEARQLLRSFVRECHQQRRQITVSVVLDHFIASNIIRQPYDEKDRRAARESVRQFIKWCGYKHGKQSGKLELSVQTTALRDAYITKLIENQQKPPPQRLREVYLDESYVHRNHHYLQTHNWYDEADEEDCARKLPHKGLRFCFVAAIQNDVKLLQDRPSETPQLRAGLVKNSFWHFSPSRKDHHSGDYHKAFNGKNFTTWFQETLLPALHEPSLIIMDNAAYHKVREDFAKGYQWSSMKKIELQAYCDQKSIPYSNETKSQLMLKIKEWREQNVPILVEKLAHEHANGPHKILWTPPYFSDLQPIEMVWAHIKRNIASQYSAETTFENVRERLDSEFSNLDTEQGSQIIQRTIQHCERLVQELWQDIQGEDTDETPHEELSTNDQAVNEANLLPELSSDGDSESDVNESF